VEKVLINARVTAVIVTLYKLHLITHSHGWQLLCNRRTSMLTVINSQTSAVLG